MDDRKDFVVGLGRPFLAHRLRRLSELLLQGYGDWLPEAGVTSPPRALSTMLLLHRCGPAGVVEIAERLRLSHPLIIKLTAQLQGAGLVSEARDPADGRRRVIALTDLGQAEVRRIGEAAQLMERAFADLCDEAGVDLLAATEAFEAASAHESLPDRLRRVTNTPEKKQCA